jgi:VWFA-related protein
MGKAVSGLRADSFQVFEDGRPQQIALFEAEDLPVAVGLVIDNSGSMRNKLPEVMAAAEEFARSSNPHDEMFVVNFNQTVSMGLPTGIPFTSDVNQLLGAVSRNRASGNTALYDGLATALDHVKTGTANRKALIVISDGGDNASRTSFRELLKRAQGSNAQVYTLGVFDKMYTGEHPGILKTFAKVTGGKAYFPESPSEIVGICQQIAHALRHQYTLGYHPSSPHQAGAYHSIRVTARTTGGGSLRVSTRAGYIMPAELLTTPTPSKASL